MQSSEDTATTTPSRFAGVGTDNLTPRNRFPSNDIQETFYVAKLDDTSIVTAQQISDFDHERRQQREKLTLFLRPLETIYLFIKGTVKCCQYFIMQCMASYIVLYIILPLIALWYALEQVEGPHSLFCDRIEFAVKFVAWWLGLGILSSIGLGSGLQSGVLFMFPHIFKVVLAANTCKTLDFDSDSNMWFQNPSTLFKCPSVHGGSIDADVGAGAGAVTFFGIWKKIILVCFFQAAGTAIGEIPPYWISRATRLAAIETGTSSMIGIPEELENNSNYNFVNDFKTWMVKLLRTHGFYGVLLMASFPNIAFDVCGICCGHFLMPFWTFFCATFLGKSVIRNAYQSVIYVALCSERYLELLIQLLQHLVPDGLHLDNMIRQVLEEGRNSFQTDLKQSSGLSGDHQSLSTGEQVNSFSGFPTTEASYSLVPPTDSSSWYFYLYSTCSSFLHYFSISVEFDSVGDVFFFWWKVFMLCVLCTFALSCISQFAQYYQMTVDQEASEKLRNRLPHHVIKHLRSPISGKLNLPPPTATKSRTRSRSSSHGHSAGVAKSSSPVSSPHSLSTLNSSPTDEHNPSDLACESKEPIMDNSATAQ